MKVAVVMGALALVACKPTPPRMVSRQEARAPIVEVREVRWTDRETGAVEVAVACRRETIEIWCGDVRECERRVSSSTAECPDTDVTLRAGDAWTYGRLGRGGIVAFRLPSTPVAGPEGDWDVAIGRRVPPARPVAPAAAPSAVATIPRPAPPPTRRRYHGAMIAADLIGLGLGITVTLGTESKRAFLGTLAIYAVSGPIVHAAHGNRHGAGNSLARRVLIPGGAALVVGGLVYAAEGCGGSSSEWCGIYTGVAGIVTLTIGAAVAIGIDWSRAKVQLAPVVYPERGGGLAIAGRF